VRKATTGKDFPGREFLTCLESPSGWLRSGCRGDQREQLAKAHRLDKVMIESGDLGAMAVFGLTVPGDGDQCTGGCLLSAQVAVDRLVRAHGGSVKARSQGRGSGSGSGSEFIVRLRAYRLSEVPHLPSHPT
jgi:hypothetical protein